MVRLRKSAVTLMRLLSTNLSTSMPRRFISSYTSRALSGCRLRSKPDTSALYVPASGGTCSTDRRKREAVIGSEKVARYRAGSVRFSEYRAYGSKEWEAIHRIYPDLQRPLRVF